MSFVFPVAAWLCCCRCGSGQLQDPRTHVPATVSSAATAAASPEPLPECFILL